ncbi:MAG: type II secretion system protein M [Pseudomonadota bacterium]
MDRLMQWWQNSSPGRWYASRDAQEQRIVSVLAALVVLSVLWLGLWKPVSDWKATSENRYRVAVGNLDWLKENMSQIPTNPQAEGGNASLRVITETARTRGLKLSRVQPDGEGGINVVLQDQPFNAVLGLIAQLGENNGVTATRAAIDGAGTPGQVNAQIRFQ